MGEPVLKESADHYCIAYHRDAPAQPVRPAEEECRSRAKVGTGKIGEAFEVQVGEQQFAHGAHDEVDEQADDHIDEDDRRAGEGDDLPRAHR